MSIVAGDIIQIPVKLLLPDGVESFNVFDFECLAGSGSLNNLVFLTAAEAFFESVYNNVQNDINQTIIMSDSEVVTLIWETDRWLVDKLIGTLSPTWNGNSIVGAMPNHTAGVVTFPTKVPKRRGRKFVPGYAEDKVGDNSLVGTAQTNLGLWAAALLTGFTIAPDFEFEYTVRGDDGIVSTPDQSVVNTFVGTQRRRKPGVGI